MGDPSTYDEMRVVLLPDSRLVLEHSPSTTEALVELGSRPRVDMPNLVIYRSESDHANAVEFIRTLKSDQHLAPIPIIVVTPCSVHGETNKLYATGASCVVTSSSNIPETKSALEALREFWVTVATLPYCSEPATSEVAHK